MRDVNRQLALKYVLFIGFMLLTWRVSTAITSRMNYEFENNAFKQTAIQDVIREFIYFSPKRKTKRGVIIQGFNQSEQTITYGGGCGFVSLIHYSKLGDTVFKQADTFRIRLKNPLKDTIINDDL